MQPQPPRRISLPHGHLPDEGRRRAPRTDGGGQDGRRSGEGGQNGCRSGEAGHDGCLPGEAGHDGCRSGEGGQNGCRSGEAGHDENRPDEAGHDGRRSEDSRHDRPSPHVHRHDTRRSDDSLHRTRRSDDGRWEGRLADSGADLHDGDLAGPVRRDGRRSRGGFARGSKGRAPREGRRHIRRRIRPRRVAALTAVTALTLAVSTSAGTGHLTAPTTAGPVGAARSSALAPCTVHGGLDVQMTEGLPTPHGYARSTGTVHALTLMVDFSDAPGQGSAMDRFHEFFPQTQEWFRTASYGRLDYRPETPITGWLRMPKSFKEYGIERGAPFDPGYRQLVQDIVNAADPTVDFRSYDLLNVLITPNAGPSALDTVLSVTFAGNTDAPVADGVPIANASFVYSRQDDGSGSYGRTGYRVLPHENGHTFGLPDLYTQEGGGAVGHWDIMSEDWGANNDLLAWHKWKLGWLDSSQVACAAKRGTVEYQLTPLYKPGGGKLILVPVNTHTSYALEAREQGGNDEAICRPGLLIYRVDGTIDTGRGPVTVYDSHPHSGGCTRNPNVEAELSDAPFSPGSTFKDPRHGITVQVLGKDDEGTYRVRVTRR